MGTRCKTSIFRLTPYLVIFCLGLSMAASEPQAVRPSLLEGVHRVVFLGDSITAAGDYVTDVECGLLAKGIRLEVLNLGLASETATDLTEEENAAHLRGSGFGRPFVSERLERALSATKPDLLIVCYGMNDGSSLPTDASGLTRFSAAVTRLREATGKAGVKRVVICTPPVHDAKGNPKLCFHDENLTRFSAWLVAQRTHGWDVVDIHTPMRLALDAGKAHDPAFALAKDGVHPGRDGHWLMAREILTQSFGMNLDGMASAEAMFPAHGAEIRALVHQRMEVLFNAWMSKIGHQRPKVAGGPGAAPGLPVDTANEQAAALGKQIDVILSGNP